jgi:chitin synthase
MASAGNAVGIYNGLIYDLTSYVKNGPAVKVPYGQAPPADTDVHFMDQSVVQLFQMNSGQDITKRLNALQLDPDVLQRQKVCLRNLFTIGKVDTRNSPACLFSQDILLVLSIVMVSIIGFKFIASINFSSERAPENHDKFVICQIPCYTEGELSLRRTIDSLAVTKYDDKRKLLVVICDGTVIGAGNEKSTPQIALDILGHDMNQNAEPLSFLSLGEGTKQHNMGKVYSGLYEIQGHVVPYLVVVKVGRSSEKVKPGNRGKRDSQMLLMHFLNKVRYSDAIRV